MLQMVKSHNKGDSADDSLEMDDLVRIACGHTAFQLLWAGHKLDLFSVLSNQPGLSLEQVASQLGLELQPARILLVGLTSLKLIIRSEDGYRNSGLADKVLVPGRPGSIAPVLGWQAEIVYPGLLDFIPSLQQNRNVGLERFPGTGDNLYQRLASNPEIEKVFQDAMSALSIQANAHLLDVAPLDGARHLVDVGGGDATNAMAFARKFPNLRVTIFDSPTVCEIAEQNIAQAGLSDRVDTHPGDIFIDKLPEGIDTILFSHMFTIWSPEKAKTLIGKSYASLPSGGRLLIFNMMADDDESGPISTALGSPYFLAIATGEGMLYSWKDYESWLAGSGFAQVVRVDDLPLEHGLLLATK